MRINMYTHKGSPTTFIGVYANNCSILEESNIVISSTIKRNKLILSQWIKISSSCVSLTEMSQAVWSTDEVLKHGTVYRWGSKCPWTADPVWKVFCVHEYSKTCQRKLSGAYDPMFSILFFENWNCVCPLLTFEDFSPLLWYFKVY